MLPCYTETASPLLSQYSDSQGIHTVTKIYQNNPVVAKPFLFKIRLNYFSINSQHFPECPHYPRHYAGFQTDATTIVLSLLWKGFWRFSCHILELFYSCPTCQATLPDGVCWVSSMMQEAQRKESNWTSSTLPRIFTAYAPEEEGMIHIMRLIGGKVSIFPTVTF